MAKIDKIVLKLRDDKEVELSLDEAKELQQILADMFGKSHLVVKERVIERDRYRPYRWPYTTWQASDNISWDGMGITTYGAGQHDRLTTGTVTLSLADGQAG